MVALCARTQPNSSQLQQDGAQSTRLRISLGKTRPPQGGPAPHLLCPALACITHISCAPPLASQLSPWHASQQQPASCPGSSAQEAALPGATAAAPAHALTTATPCCPAGRLHRAGPAGRHAAAQRGPAAGAHRERGAPHGGVHWGGVRLGVARCWGGAAASGAQGRPGAQGPAQGAAHAHVLMRVHVCACACMCIFARASRQARV